MPSTVTQSARDVLEAQAHEFIEKYYPDALPEKRHEHIFTVRHHPHYMPPSYVECRTTKMHEQGKLRRSKDYRWRFLGISSISEPLGEGYPEHGAGAGSCPGCTQRWRIAHGLPADVSDVVKRLKDERRK
jgi:hypothetical protein